MKPVDMTVYGKGEGDCFAACVASLLELNVADVFDAREVHRQCTDDNSAPFWRGWDGWLKTRGLEMHFHANTDGIGTCIVSGVSPRYGDDTHHAVLWSSEGLVYDPHINRTGIVGDPTHFITLEPRTIGTFGDDDPLPAPPTKVLP